MIIKKITTEQAKSLEDFVESHMYLCQADLNGIEDLPDDWEPYGPYDGCTTCETREYLMATLDWLKNNDILDLVIEDPDDELRYYESTLF